VIATSRTLLGDGGLFLVAAPIVADAENVPLEATVAARGIVPVDATQLAVDVGAAAAIGSHRRATGRGRRRGLATRSTSCGWASRRARRTIATRSTTTVGGMGVGVVQLHRGMAGVNTLLGGEEARVQVPLGRGRLTTPHRLNQVVVVLVETPKDKVRELRVPKRLPDSGQGISKRLDLVEVVVRGGVKLLTILKLLTNS
jgi:hypothetical protein